MHGACPQAGEDIVDNASNITHIPQNSTRQYRDQATLSSGFVSKRPGSQAGT